MDAETRALFLMNKKKQLQELLAVPVDTVIPASVTSLLDVSNSSTTFAPSAQTSSQTSTVDAAAKRGPGGASKSSTTTTTTSTTYSGGGGSGTSPQTLARPSALQGVSSSSSSASPPPPPSSSSSSGTSYSGQRFPTLAPSAAAKLTAKQQTSNIAAASRAATSITRTTSPSASSSPPPPSTSSSSSSPPTTTTTYQQKLQLNARYGLHARANADAAAAAAAKLQQDRVHSSSQGAAPLLAPAPPPSRSSVSMEGSPSSSSSSENPLLHTFTPASPPRSNANQSTSSSSSAAAAALSSPRRSMTAEGSAATSLLRSTSPVQTMTTAGNGAVQNRIGTDDGKHQEEETQDTIHSKNNNNNNNFTNSYSQEQELLRARAEVAVQRALEAATSFRGPGGGSKTDYELDMDKTLQSVITNDDDEEDDHEDDSHSQHKNREGSVRDHYQNQQPILSSASKQWSPTFTMSPSPTKTVPQIVSAMTTTTTTSSSSSTGNTTTAIAPMRLFPAQQGASSSSSPPTSPSPSRKFVNAAPITNLTPTLLSHQSPVVSSPLDASVAAFLRQIDEMDSQLGFSIVSTAAATGNSGSATKQSNSRQGEAADNVRGGAPPALSPSSPLPTTPSRRPVAGGSNNNNNNQPLPSSSSPSAPSSSSSRMLDLSAASLTNDTATFHNNNNNHHHTDVGSGALPQTSSSSSSSAYASIRTKVVAMTMELEEKGRTIAVMRAQLAQAKKVLLTREKEYQENINTRVNTLRSEYEAAIENKLGFIEHLLSDKASLATQVSVLTKKLDTERTLNAEAAEIAERRLRTEVERTREAVLQQERTRRNAWQEATTKQIKERTLKGLEPDIQKFLAKHTEEIQKIQEACAEEIAAAAARFQAEKDVAVAQVLESATGEGAEALKAEKQAWRVRETALRDEYDKELLSIREKYRADIEDERRRSAAVARADASRALDDLARLQTEWQTRIDALLKRHAEDKASFSTTLADAVAAEGKRQAESRDAWETRTLVRIRREFEEKEREIRAESNKNRDEQLKLVIARFDSEMQEERRKSRSEVENRVKETREEAQRTIEAMGQEIATWKARSEEAIATRDAAMASSGDTAVRLAASLDAVRAELSSVKGQLRHVQSQFEEALIEKEVMRDANASVLAEARRTHAKEIASYASALETAEQDRASILAQATQDIAALQAKQSETMNEMQVRVNAALKKREEVIQSLKLQLQEETTRADTAKKLMIEGRQEMESLFEAGIGGGEK